MIQPTITINSALIKNIKVPSNKPSNYFNYPTKADLKKLNKGTLNTNNWYEINQDNRLKTYKSLLSEQGYKYVLDASVCGAGKSYNNGFIYNEEFNVDYVFIISKSPKNPTTASVEEVYNPFPVRHKGLHESATEVTPTGQPMVFRATKDKPVNIEANCSKTNEFRSAFSLAAKVSPCATCTHQNVCKSSQGEGYGYLAELREASVDEHFRIHANSLKSAFSHFGIFDVDVENKTIFAGEPSVLVIIDEFDQSIDLTEQVSYTKVEIQRFVDYIDSYKDKLETSLRQEAKVVTDFWSQFLHLKQGSTQKVPCIDEFILRKLFQVLPSAVWNLHNGEFKIVATVNEKGVEAQGFNNSFFELLRLDNVQVLVQDATTNVSIIRELFPGVICLHQPFDNLNNLTITQVTGINETRSSRGQQSTAKINKVIARDYKKHGKTKTGIIDWKVFTPELTHLNTGRGSNKFETRKHLIIVGLPKINLGAAKLTHAALTTGVEFNDFYSHNSKAELIQELGRLRHGRRLNEKLTCTIISNDDLTFLENLGFNIVQESYENFING